MEFAFSELLTLGYKAVSRLLEEKELKINESQRQINLGAIIGKGNTRGSRVGYKVKLLDYWNKKAIYGYEY